MEIFLSTPITALQYYEIQEAYNQALVFCSVIGDYLIITF